MSHYRAELHVHTVLSPCAGIEMLPPLIVETALESGINLIGIVDHNASANVAAVIQAASGTALHVIPGIELETAEEIHALCLFDTLAQTETFQNIIDQNLPYIENNEAFFGSQLVVDWQGNFLRKVDKLLVTSTLLSLQESCQLVQSMGGLFIPAHVDREANGLFSHLGTIPPDLSVDIFEITRFISDEKAMQRFPQLKGHHLIQGGDVHDLDGFLGAVEIDLVEVNIQSIARAIASKY